MTSKERVLTALRRGKPDRLPVTIHQWQPFHLRAFMNGMDQLEAFRAVGLDASIMPLDVWRREESPRWRCRSEDAGRSGEERLTRHFIETPDGGYICSASDHFFHTPVENLKALAGSANGCEY